MLDRFEFLLELVNKASMFYPIHCKEIKVVRYPPENSTTSGCFWVKYSLMEIFYSEKKSLMTMLLALAHETIHSEQVYEDRLGMPTKDGTYFEGIVYRDVAYKDQPWEKEAYQLESLYLAKFINILDREELDRLQEDYNNFKDLQFCDTE